MHKKLIARWIWGGVAFLAILTFTLDQIGAKRSSDALTAEREAARRAGISLFVSELAKPMPPADQNAAVIYESMPAHDSKDARTAAIDKLYASLIKSPTTLNTEDWQAVREAVAEESPLLRAAHEALGKPACVFHHDYQTAHPEDILLPELARMRNCARQLSMESLLMAHDGKGVAAVANARSIFRLAYQANTDPTLIGYLVAVAIDNITTNTMQKILLLAPNGATAKAVLATLKSVSLLSPKSGLGSELAFEQTICETLRHGGVGELQKLMSTTNDEKGIAPVPVSGTLASSIALSHSFWSRIIDKNALELLRAHRAIIAVCDQPYSESQPAIERILARQQAAATPEDFIATILLPLEGKLMGKRAVAANKFAVTQAAAAVLAYRAAHGGTLPTTLEAAMPNPPMNAFDDMPLDYALTAEGFTVGALDPANPIEKSSVSVFSFPTAY